MVSFSKKKTEKVVQRQKGTIVELLEDSDKQELIKADLPEELIVVVKDTSYFYVDDQVRTEFPEHELKEMALALQNVGQKQAMTVHPKDKDGRYLIDDGECRWRSAQRIPGFTLKAIVDPEAPKRNRQRRIIEQLIANDQRNDLGHLDMAKALKDLAEDGLNQEEIAKELGWITKNEKPNINRVSRILSILKLPEEGIHLVKEDVVTDLLTLDFLRKIHGESKDKFLVLCSLALEDGGISRKRAEQEYKQCIANKASKQSESKEESVGKDEFSHERNSKPVKESIDVPEEGATQPGAASVDSNAKSAVKSSPAVLQNNDTPLQSPTNNVRSAVIHVEWNGRKLGELMLDKEPEAKGFVWVKLNDSGDEISAEVHELMIKQVCV